MTPITDPALIAKLEGSGGQSLGTPVTNPALIAQLEGNTAQTNPSLLPRLGTDALAGLAQLGHGLINSQNNLVQNIAPSGYLKPGEGLPTLPDYDYGKMLGVNAPNLGDKLIQGAAQYAPYMAIPGGALTQGAVFGLTQSKDPLIGGIAGGILGKLGDVAPSAIGAIPSTVKKLTGAIQPQKQAEQILNTLGNGNTLEGNAQSLAHDIKNAFNNRVEQGQALYQPVFDAAGKNSIYQGLDPANSAYQTLESGLLKSNRNLNTLHQKFTENPTLQNAHNLQSQLGTAIRKLQMNDAKGNLSVADRNTMQGYQAAQSAVRSDINDFLKSKNPALANQYNLATQNWAQNVTPYLENSKIAQIAKGDVTNPKNITNLFAKPEPELQQIVDDIGPQAANKILYSELGKTQSNLTPEKLTNAFNQLDNKGLSSYVTPELAQQFDQLVSKTTARNAARTAGGALIGAHFGGPVGAAAGAVATPILSSAITRGAQFLPTLRMQLLKNALAQSGADLRPLIGTLYKPLPGAIAADAVNSMGNK